MNAQTLKGFRPLSLVLFVVGVVALVLTIGIGSEFAFFAAAFVTSSSLCYFTFTEAFLFRPPERKRVDVWNARVFFVVSLLSVLSLGCYLLSDLL